jgi:predicted HTH domain antitoxin
MMMKNETLKMTVPENVFTALNLKPAELLDSMREEYAARMFQQGKLSLGLAAELCGMQKFDFTSVLAAKNIPVIDYDLDDFKEELNRLGV